MNCAEENFRKNKTSRMWKRRTRFIWYYNNHITNVNSHTFNITTYNCDI